MDQLQTKDLGMIVNHNVHDHLKDLSVDDVKEYCERNLIPASVAMMHVNGDFNFSQIIRTANFLGFRDVHYWGKKRWDRRGAVGTHHYTPIVHHTDEESLIEYCLDNHMTPVALENNHNFSSYEVNDPFWINNLDIMIIIGEESDGLSDELLRFCEQNGFIVTIPCRGSVRSLNVASAFGIAAAFYESSFR
jgi:tRNA G18 (ribose-2'-O)-methylase SpoU